MDPAHGIDYLIDYYAILRVKRDADAHTIKKAYHDQQFLYHPDRYAHLAPEFQKQAEARSRIVTDAYKILYDSSGRAAYDEKLASWKGSISQDGTAIVDPTKSYFSCAALLFSPDEGEIKKLIDTVMDQLSGYNPGTFELVEALFHATKDPTEKVKRAYQEQLQKKDMYLSIKENMAWAKIGFHNQPVGGMISLVHGKEITETIEKNRGVLEKEIARTLMMLGTGELKAIGPGGEELQAACTQNPQQALQIYYTKAMERFGSVSGEITALADERVNVAEKRLDSIICVYIPAEQLRCSRLILVVRTPEFTKGFHFHLISESHVVSDIVLSAKEVEELQDPACANQWIEKGHSIMFMDLLVGIDATDQVQRSVQRHFEEFLKTSGQTP